MVNAAIKQTHKEKGGIKTSLNTVTATVAASLSPLCQGIIIHFILSTRGGLIAVFKIPYQAEIQTYSGKPYEVSS